jgi:FAD:protein FMN transferase
MATRFELVLEGASPARLRAAGEEAVATIQRLEAQLSFYRPTSDIGRINAGAAAGPVRVTPELFGLLRRAQELHDLTGGRFDITTGPLTRLWRDADGGAMAPSAAAVEAVRSCVGMHLVELDAASCTVRFARPGLQIDLGAIGKGYALDQAALVLREAGVERALLHGGTSSIHGMDAPAGEDAWRVAIERPGAEEDDPAARVLAIVPLRDAALSVSTPRGRTYRTGGATHGHVMDPRTGMPGCGAVLAAAVCAAGTDADATATALLLPGSDGGAAPWPLGTDVLVVDTVKPGSGARTWSHGLAFHTTQPEHART